MAKETEINIFGVIIKFDPKKEVVSAVKMNSNRVEIIKEVVFGENKGIKISTPIFWQQCGENWCQEFVDYFNKKYDEIPKRILMPKQELAKAIDNLNWGNIQCDNPADGAAYEVLFKELMELDKSEAIRLLFAVLEAQNLPDDFMGENRIMHEFKNV